MASLVRRAISRFVDQHTTTVTPPETPTEVEVPDFEKLAQAHRDAWCSPWVQRLRRDSDYGATSIGDDHNLARISCSHEMQLAFATLQQAAIRAGDLPAVQGTALQDQIDSAIARVYGAARTLAGRGEVYADLSSPMFAATIELAARTVALIDLAHHALDVEQHIDTVGLRHTAALLITELQQVHQVLGTQRVAERTMDDFDRFVEQTLSQWPLVHSDQWEWGSGYHVIRDTEKTIPVSYRPHWYSVRATATRHEPTNLYLDRPFMQASMALEQAQKTVTEAGLPSEHPLLDQIDRVRGRFLGLARITSAQNCLNIRPPYTDGVERAQALGLAANVTALASLVEERETIIADLDTAGLRNTARRLALTCAKR